MLDEGRGCTHVIHRTDGWVSTTACLEYDEEDILVCCRWRNQALPDHVTRLFHAYSRQYHPHPFSSSSSLLHFSPVQNIPRQQHPALRHFAESPPAGTLKGC